MAEYTPPLRDIKLVLHHIAGIDDIIEYPGFEHVDRETIEGALDEAGRFMAEAVRVKPGKPCLKIWPT